MPAPASSGLFAMLASSTQSIKNMLGKPVVAKGPQYAVAGTITFAVVGYSAYCWKKRLNPLRSIWQGLETFSPFRKRVFADIDSQ